MIVVVGFGCDMGCPAFFVFLWFLFVFWCGLCGQVFYVFLLFVLVFGKVWAVKCFMVVVGFRHGLSSFRCGMGGLVFCGCPWFLVWFRCLLLAFGVVWSVRLSMCFYGFC
jgi:hypothetical protein